MCHFYNEGFDCRKDGGLWSDNPYASGSTANEKWRAGYFDSLKSEFKK